MSQDEQLLRIALRAWEDNSSSRAGSWTAESQVGAILTVTLREAAERILLVSDLALGYRCPACHGQPAVDRWRRTGGKRRYVCGCGHQWDPLTWSGEYRVAQESSPSALLRKVLETGELPAIPAKVERDTRELR